jgi:putative membrane protein
MGLVFKLLLFVGCTGKTDKENVEKLNRDRFSERRDQKDAQFIVNAVDKSYALQEMALLGEEKIQDPLERVRLRQFIEAHSSVSARLRTFAEANDVSIPFAGPEKTKQRVENLHTKDGDEFHSDWKRQIRRLHSEFEQDLSRYRDRAGESLQIFLDSTLVTVRSNVELLKE